VYHCSHCNISLEEYFYQDILLYRCPGCKGFWFQRSRFGQVKNLGFEGLLDANLSPPQEVRDLEAPGPLSCPQCQTELITYIYAYSSGIPLRRCTTCEGIWATQPQLSAIVQVLNNYRESLEEAKLKVLPLILKVRENLEKEHKEQFNSYKGSKLLNKLLSKLGFYR